jgi:type IV secretion system protein TrbL
MAKAEAFTGSLTATLSPMLEGLFISLLTAWSVVIGIRLLLEGMSVLKSMGRDLFLILLSFILLSSQSSGLITDAYKASLDIIGGASKTAFEVAGGAPAQGYDGLSALLATLEHAIAGVIYVAGTVKEEGGMTDLGPYVLALLLILPYFVLVVYYLAQVVVAIFRIITVTAMVPILALFLAFGWGRQMAISGLKVVISSGLVLYACTIAIALAISAVTSINIQDSGKDLDSFADFTNPDLLLAIVMGWTGIALMHEATSIANSVAGSFLSNAGAMIMAGAALAAPAMGLKSAAGGAAKMLTDPGGTAEKVGGWVDRQRNFARQTANLVNKVRGANKPSQGESSE